MRTIRTSLSGLVTSLAITFILVSCSNNTQENQSKMLELDFSGDAKIEVGGTYAGVEFHHSSFLPQRISFYYPVANSIDMSVDYWKRDTSFIMAAGLKVNDKDKVWLRSKECDISLTPYSVAFKDLAEDAAILVSYRFAKNKPAFVIEYRITNNTNSENEYEFYTSLEAALKTCHTFKLVDEAWTDYSEKYNAVIANYNDPETMNARVFSINVGEKPVSWSSISDAEITPNQNTDHWMNNDGNLDNGLISKEELDRPAFKYQYRKSLKPQETLTVKLVVGSCTESETEEMIDYLSKNYQKEIDDYENDLMKKISSTSKLETNDEVLDNSVLWAKAILEATQHYIDGDIAPMPCPAEYNFYFAHDVLVTDMAAVNYDLTRVKRDLQFLMKRSNDEHIIPHAYYFKDGKYVTEFADHDNWNNFWINLVAASYLRHSGDKVLLKELYPYLTESTNNALRTYEDDGLMWSYRPDWWDIGRNYGSKTYMTLLAARSLQEYIYVSYVLGMNSGKLVDYEKMWTNLKDNLVEKLWSDEQNYLINYYEPSKIDTHYYTGSLLAPHFDMLDSDKSAKLIESAQKYLVDDKVGVYCVYPMDFVELSDYLNFVGNEVGAKWYYLNGGIWPQDNAWYSLALIKNGQRDEAFKFVRNTMTIDGIMNGPNGQPAMYEVRNGNSSDPATYGQVDKPTFMWAGGWYIFSLYHLFLIEESSWNVSFNPYLQMGNTSALLSLTINGSNIDVNVSGKSEGIPIIRYNGQVYPSLVIPDEYDGLNSADISLGKLESPMLTSTEAVLENASYKNNGLTAEVSAFPGHRNTTTILSPSLVKSVEVNNELINNYSEKKVNEYYELSFTFTHTKESKDLLKIIYSD